MRYLGWAIIVSFLIDQISKWAILYWLDLPSLGIYPVYPPFLQFHMAWNYGVNFGLFAQNGDIGRWVLIAIAIGISGFVAVWSWRKSLPILGMISSGLLIGGALANALDRIIYGAVVDFLNMSCCGINNPFAFNIADVFIFAGAIGLAFFGEAEKDG